VGQEIGKDRGIIADNINLQVLAQNINTGDATGRLLFNMLGAIAQSETEIRAERQMDGIQKAKERCVSFDLKKKLTQEQCAQLRRRREQGERIKILMKDYNLSKVSVYRYLGKKMENSGLSLECTFSERCAKNPNLLPN